MKFIEKFVDLPRLIKTLYIMLWAVLIGLVILKITFNVWYPIVMENNTFTKVCSFIDSKDYLKLLTNFILYVFTANILFLTFTGRFKYERWYNFLLFNLVHIPMFFVKKYISPIGLILELGVIALSIVLNIKRNRFDKKITNILLPIIIYILMNIWQLNMLFIKDVDVVLSSSPTLILLIVQSDYHIFLIISWIGVSGFMGISSYGWFFGKSDSELKEIRARELSKKAPDLKMVAEIEKILKDRKVEF